MIIDENSNLYEDGNYAEVLISHSHTSVFKSLSLQKEKKNKKIDVCNPCQ